MAIPINRWSKQVFGDLAIADSYSEALDSISVEAGWHDQLGSDNSFLVAEKTLGLNQYGYPIRRDETENDYDYPGAPLKSSVRTTYAKVYLPGVNAQRSEILVEEETQKMYPWTLFQQGSPNLSRHRILKGWVVYDMNPDGTGLSAEQKDELRAKGMNPDGPPKIIVDSGRSWEEANQFADTVESPTAPQTSEWKTMETEFEIVFEEIDKYTSYTYKKNHLRPGQMTVSGPNFTRKPNYQYPLEVDIEPPEIEAVGAGDDGILVTVTGGGATVHDQRVQPEQYRVLRKTISQPPRPADSDPFDLYDENAPSSSQATMWIDTDVQDLSGAPASSVPPETSYDEPGDTSEPEGDDWKLVGLIDNETPTEDSGVAKIIDSDVVNLGEYEYVATAIIRDDESLPSSPDRWIYGGATRKSSLSVYVGTNADGSKEIDVIAPDQDTGSPNASQYGETKIFEDLPVALLDDDDARSLGDEIGRRHFAESLAPKLRVDMEVSIPLIILERGQKITTPAVDWTTTGNGLVITSELETRDWTLDGFKISASISDEGQVSIQGTTLYLEE